MSGAVYSGNNEGRFQHIDIMYLQEICPENENFTFTMLDIFRKGSVKHIEKIRSCFSSGDFEELSDIAHMIKPTGSYIGSTSYTAIVHKLEQAADERNHTKAARLIESMQDVTNAIIQEINTYLEGRKG
jgi:HPt (histidine-containing phosphotransfer) domain-containing protein